MKNFLLVLFLCFLALNCGANKTETSKVSGSNNKNLSSESASKKDSETDKGDTTVKIDLNGDGSDETISMIKLIKRDKSQSWIEGYKLTVNDKITEKILDIAALEVNLVTTDINKSDKQKEIVVNINIDPDGMEFHIYNFNGNNLNAVNVMSNFFYEDKEPFPGDGKVYTNNWMGFWEIYDIYTYNTEKNTLTKDNTTGIYDIVYPSDLKPEIKVTKSFRLRKERNDKAELVTMLTKGTVIKILKADISTKCKEPDNEDYLCHWYYIESKEGNGWVKLIDFKDNVEGLPWAG